MKTLILFIAFIAIVAIVKVRHAYKNREEW